MAIFRSDYMTPDPNKYAGVSTSQGTAYAPVPATPSVPSAPSTSAQISALSSRAPQPQPTATSNPLFSGINSAVQSLGAVAQALAARGQQAQQNASPAPTQVAAPVSRVSENPPSLAVSTPQPSPTKTPYRTPTATSPGNLPPDYTRQPTPTTLTNEQLLARFRPELVQGADGTDRLSVTNAGLQAPRRENFATLEEFQNAEAAFRENRLAEQSSIASSSQFRDAMVRNAEIDAAEAAKARTRGFEATQGELERRQANQRQRLIDSLATRGLAAGRDSEADDRLREFDRLASQEREAKYAEYILGTLDISEERRKNALKEVNDRITATAEAMKQFETLKMTKAKSVNEAKKTEIAEKKLALDQAYKMGILDVREWEAKTKQLEAESRGELRSAQTENVEQKTVESKELLPGKKEAQEAATELKQAQKQRIETLTPLEAAKMRAATNKLLTQSKAKGGIGRSLSKDDYDIAYDLALQLNNGKNPSDKMVAEAAKRVFGDTSAAPQDVVKKVIDTARSAITENTKAREAGQSDGGFRF